MGRNPSLPRNICPRGSKSTKDKISFRNNCIVHPLCSDAHVSSFSFGYPFTEAAVNDWAWVTPKNTENIVQKKIVTSKEADVLVKLGSLLRCNEDLNSNEIAKLYTDFFEDKNPFDVIYTLLK